MSKQAVLFDFNCRNLVVVFNQVVQLVFHTQNTGLLTETRTDRRTEDKLERDKRGY